MKTPRPEAADCLESSRDSPIATALGDADGASEQAKIVMEKHGPRVPGNRSQHLGVSGVHKGSRFMRPGVSVAVGGGGTSSVMGTGACDGRTAPPVGVEQEAASTQMVPMTSTISATAAIC